MALPQRVEQPRTSREGDEIPALSWAGRQEVRVLLAEGRSAVSVDLLCSCCLEYCCGEDRSCQRSDLLGSLKFGLSEEDGHSHLAVSLAGEEQTTLCQGTLAVHVAKMIAQTNDSTPTFRLGGCEYAGRLAVHVVNHVGQKPSLSVVNTLPLEAYLVGVVGREMPLGWADAALQAQGETACVSNIAMSLLCR